MLQSRRPPIAKQTNSAHSQSCHASFVLEEAKGAIPHPGLGYPTRPLAASGWNTLSIGARDHTRSRRACLLRLGPGTIYELGPPPAHPLGSFLVLVFSSARTFLFALNISLPGSKPSAGRIHPFNTRRRRNHPNSTPYDSHPPKVSYIQTPASGGLRTNQSKWSHTAWCCWLAPLPPCRLTSTWEPTRPPW